MPALYDLETLEVITDATSATTYTPERTLSTMNTQGFYEYTQRKPRPKVYTHNGAPGYNAACLCPCCLAEYRRRNPSEYAVTQAKPAKKAKIVDLTTDGELPAHLWTSKPTKHPQPGKHAAVKLKAPADKRETHVTAALVLHL